jgi:hypothetical protein
MALTPEELKELEALKSTPGLSDDYRWAAQEHLDAAKDESLAGWAKAGGTKADSAPVVPGQLGMKGIIGQEGQGGAAPADAEAQRLAGMLDPRFSLVPQILAMQPNTSHPGGDAAAKQDFEAGKTPVYVYEPPVDVVRRHLLENPALLRAIRPDEPPQMEEIANLNSSSPLYKETSDYMWTKALDAAKASGKNVVRYSTTPWSQTEGRGPVAADQANAFVLGLDDTAAFGAGRAVQEAASPTSQMNPDKATLGLNESVPQSTADLNAWNAQEHPVAYGAGQAVGGLVGAPSKLWELVQKSGAGLARLAGKATVGGVSAGAVANLAPGWLKSAAGVVGDAAVGGVAAGGEQLGQEAVDYAARGEMPDLSEVGERVSDVGKTGAYLGAAGSVVGHLAHGGAEHIRDSPRYSGVDTPQGGLVRATEPNLDWRARRAFTGPKLNEGTQSLLKKSTSGGYQPGDVLAEEIAGPVGAAAQANTRAARVQSDIERRAYQASPEGSGVQPVTHLERMSLEKLRDYHQPQADGSLRPVDNGFREAHQVFNRHLDGASLEPIKGAVELNASEANAFLGVRARYQLVKDDIAKVTRERLNKPVDRNAYLANKPKAARDGVNEEIEADIDDLIGFDQHGVPRTVDKRSAEYKTAEKQVLRERVDTETALEPFGGSLAEYLKQRGKDRVYVKPAAYDARRTDTIVGRLKDPDLVEAAKYDRQQFRKGGERGADGKPVKDGRGGYELMQRRHGERIGEAEAVEKEVAPGGDAFKPVAGLYQPHPGEKQLVDRVRALADQSGVRDRLDRLRGLQDTLAIHNRARGAGPTGSRSPLSPNTWVDVGQLRAFPLLRSLEGPLGPLRGGNPARAALLGNREDEAAQGRDESSARGKYEGRRDARMKELAGKKSAEDLKREKRRLRRQRAGSSSR